MLTNAITIVIQITFFHITGEKKSKLGDVKEPEREPELGYKRCLRLVYFKDY